MLSINLKKYIIPYLYLFTCLPDTFTREEEEEEEESQEGDETMRILDEQNVLGPTNCLLACFLLHSCYVYVRTYVRVYIYIHICGCLDPDLLLASLCKEGGLVVHSRKLESDMKANGPAFLYLHNNNR